MRELTLLLLVAAALFHLPGCSESCSCAQDSLLVVSVIDAVDGGSISSARVNDVPCPGTCVFTRKPDGGPPSAGPIDLTVIAESYQPKSLTVVVPATDPVDQGCCGLGPPWISQSVTVLLQPL
jgi:hypothetical protein